MKSVFFTKHFAVEMACNNMEKQYGERSTNNFKKNEPSHFISFLQVESKYVTKSGHRFPIFW